jgi:hypothetical protein
LLTASAAAVSAAASPATGSTNTTAYLDDATASGAVMGPQGPLYYIGAQLRGDKETVQKELKAWAHSEGFELVVHRSAADAIDLLCSRHGSYEPPPVKIEAAATVAQGQETTFSPELTTALTGDVDAALTMAEEPRQKKARVTSSKKCGCPVRVRATLQKRSNTWVIQATGFNLTQVNVRYILNLYCDYHHVSFNPYAYFSLLFITNIFYNYVKIQSLTARRSHDQNTRVCNRIACRHPRIHPLDGRSLSDESNP